MHRYVNRFEDSNSFVLNVILFDTGKLRLLSLILCIVFVHCHGTMSPDMPCLKRAKSRTSPTGWSPHPDLMMMTMSKIRCYFPTS